MRLLVPFCLLCILGLPRQVQAQSLAELYQKALSNDIAACVELSARYNLGIDGAPYKPDSGLFFLEKAALLGDADATYLVAIQHLRGLGTPKSEPKGLQWLQKAAEQQHREAVRALFELYSAQPLIFLDARIQVPQDYGKALHYAQMGTTLGDPQAAFYAGQAYRNGWGAPRNDSLAVNYLHQAATEMAYPPAQQTLGYWFFRGTTALGADFDRAYSYYQLLADNPAADFALQTTGRVGMHECVQWKRISLNLQWLWAFPDPLMAPQLEVKP
ncbi:MAG: sel1 repeat family protein [Bacteroidetes bacterium]|nr:sel1 repeat family protein [Bacteroidota bacterium]